jgi:hypothetical protein
MKQEILVYTAFTDKSRNALTYACEFAMARDYAIILIHNFDAPLNYTADPVALSTMEESIQNTEEKLAEEKNWASDTYPNLTINRRLTYGSKEDGLKELLQEFSPEFLIVGAPESQGEFWGWNNDFVDILHLIPIPTLIIPKTVSYQTITDIGFACDYASPLKDAQIKFIRNLTQVRGIQLHIIHVSIPNKKDEDQRILHRSLLERELADSHPIYVSIESSEVVASIINYVRENAIQMLMVIPHRHGMWYSIFNQRHTKRLARINHLPIITLKE